MDRREFSEWYQRNFPRENSLAYLPRELARVRIREAVRACDLKKLDAELAALKMVGKP